MLGAATVFLARGDGFPCRHRMYCGAALSLRSVLHETDGQCSTLRRTGPCSSYRKLEMSQSTHLISTTIWQDVPCPGNPTLTARARLHGYDVTELVAKAGPGEALFLLFRGRRPSTQEAELTRALNVLLLNLGPRDPSVYAAMCGGAPGSTAAACLMAALAAGAGRYGGARDVRDVMLLWPHHCGALAQWAPLLTERAPDGVWPAVAHPAGFEPAAATTAPALIEALEVLSVSAPEDGALARLRKHRVALEQRTRCGLAMSALAAAAYLDLQLTPDQGEMLYLVSRLPGAAAHALEQKVLGYTAFPFPGMDFIANETGNDA